MTWKKFKKRLQVQKKYEIYHPSGIYTGSIGSLTQSSKPEIILLTFGEKLLVYDLKGEKKLEIPFSNDVCKLFITDLFQPNEKVFVSLAFSGEIRVFSESGEVFWKIKGDTIIDGVMGNLDYDPKSEIVALLDTKQILILNNAGKTVAKYTHPEKIHYLALAKINSKDKNVILFVDSHDKLHVLDIETQVSEIPIQIKSIRGLDSLSIYDKNVVVILDGSNNINIIDKKGNLIECFTPEKKIEHIFTGYLENDKIESLFAISKDSFLINYKIEIADAKEFIETSKKGQISSTTGHIASGKKATSPGSSESSRKQAKLEFNPNYFNKEVKPFPTVESNSPSLQKTIVPKKSNENIVLKCPECGDFLPKLIIQRLLIGKVSFCEECGLELHKSDFSKDLE